MAFSCSAEGFMQLKSSQAAAFINDMIALELINLCAE